MKKILITGADSYIGTSFEKWLRQDCFQGQYQVDTLDMRSPAWKRYNMSGYDSIFHVAGIAHRKETKENAELYYSVNRDLAVETARKAEASGVKQFILLSSMSVFGKTQGVITKKTETAPVSNYGKSKLEADEAVSSMASDSFSVAVIRPPMIYGRGCKGNYQTLSKFARKTPIFPNIKNERSMLYIDFLCEFARRLIDDSVGGFFYPQNQEYICTSQLVKGIGQLHGKNVHLWKVLNPGIYLGTKMIGLINKVFGSLVYEQEMSRYDGGTYCLFSFEETLERTERDNQICQRLR